mmetsp:Transcript_5502/g.17087  ORF Transcript_5502/g.17087 Transcript_5502/m.17087 type:complete len:173 (+) Transcript_5502:1367-1885(+)
MLLHATRRLRLALRRGTRALNMNRIVDKAYETQSLRAVADAPISALQGLADWTDDAGAAALKVESVGELGASKYCEWARALVELAAYEDAGARRGAANVNFALDAAHESKSLADVLELPPSALQGLAAHADEPLARMGVKTIRDLGTWKFAAAAKAISVLADAEADDAATHK